MLWLVYEVIKLEITFLSRYEDHFIYDLKCISFSL